MQDEAYAAIWADGNPFNDEVKAPAMGGVDDSISSVSASFVIDGGAGAGQNTAAGMSREQRIARVNAWYDSQPGGGGTPIDNTISEEDLRGLEAGLDGSYDPTAPTLATVEVHGVRPEPQSSFSWRNGYGAGPISGAFRMTGVSDMVRAPSNMPQWLFDKLRAEGKGLPPAYLRERPYVSPSSGIGVRVLGGLQMIGGGLEAAGGILTATTCETGIGCVAAGYLFVAGVDNANAGWQTLVNGQPTATWGGQVVQQFGVAPDTAELAYGLTQLAPAAGEAYLANRALSTEIAYNQLARASYEEFRPAGLAVTSEVMATSQAQTLAHEIQAANPNMSVEQVARITREYLESGTSLPSQGAALPGSIVVKAMPRGDLPSDWTGYWMSPQQARAIAAMTPGQTAELLGLPASQAARIQTAGMDFFAISPTSGAKPTIFVSRVARTSQGGVRMSGGAEQIIVPNRYLWTRPVKIDPFTLKPIDQSGHW